MSAGTPGRAAEREPTAVATAVVDGSTRAAAVSATGMSVAAAVPAATVAAAVPATRERAPRRQSQHDGDDERSSAMGQAVAARTRRP